MSIITKETKSKDLNEVKTIWTREQEELLALWADKALCYRWLHDLAEKKFTRLNNIIQIPVIILSTITGALNVGIDSIFPSSMKQYANISLGGVSLVTGIISTVGNFLRYAQNMESHRVSSIQWSKFHRNISAEVAIHPDQRQDAVEFFTINRAELDRLVEQSPSIPTDIIEQFEKRFKDTDISKPEICNILEPTKIYKPSDGLPKLKTHSEPSPSMIKNFFSAFKKKLPVDGQNSSPKAKNQNTIITFDNGSNSGNNNDNDNDNDSIHSDYKQSPSQAEILHVINNK